MTQKPLVHVFAKQFHGGPDGEITFEMPGKKLYGALQFVFGAAKKDTRHVVTTVLAADGNLRHNFGEPGAHVSLIAAACRRFSRAFRATAALRPRRLTAGSSSPTCLTATTASWRRRRALISRNRA